MSGHSKSIPTSILTPDKTTVPVPLNTTSKDSKRSCPRGLDLALIRGLNRFHLRWKLRLAPLFGTPHKGTWREQSPPFGRGIRTKKRGRTRLELLIPIKSRSPPKITINSVRLPQSLPL